MYVYTRALAAPASGRGCHHTTGTGGGWSKSRSYAMLSVRHELSILQNPFLFGPAAARSPPGLPGPPPPSPSSGPMMFSSAPAAHTCACSSPVTSRSPNKGIAPWSLMILRLATSRLMFCNAPAALPQTAAWSLASSSTSRGMPSFLRMILMESASEDMLCIAPTALVCTLRWYSAPSSRSMSWMAPPSRTTARPDSWKHIDWIAPAAFAWRSVSVLLRNDTSAGTPLHFSTSSTFSFS
mmetsp:Transcript_15469/g.52840  ORF Transcript_15469/g.52840 Transcript_15469/m.52840 type:complete len:239 (-) Transcript_15469:655-1371(-)